MFITNLVYILMPITILAAFLWAPPAAALGESSRILYFHVPLAWISVIAFFVSGVFSIIYLYDKKRRYFLLEEKAYNSARIGVFFTVLAIFTGSVWSKIMWGAYWNWDPRQTSIIILMLIYSAYFSLRASLKDNPNKEKIISSYLIFAMIAVPFFIFILPRMYPTLHPNPIINPDKKIHMEQRMRMTLLLSLFSFTFLYFHLFNLLNRVARLYHREMSHEKK